MLAEAVFLLLLWLFYSVYRIRKLKGKSGEKVVIKEVTKEVTKEVKSDVEIPTYLTFLNQAMLATELRLEEEQGAKEDESEEDNFDLGGNYSNPLELRLAFIRSEISAIEASGEDGGAYWSSQEASLKEILESMPTLAAEQPEEVVEGKTETADLGDIDAIKTELSELKQQAQALEQYKTLFYGLASKLKDTSEAARPIAEQLESVKSQLEDATSVETLASSYEDEYQKLKALLDGIGEGELDDITREKLKKMLDMRTQRPKEKVVYVDKAEHKVRHEVDKIKQASAQQQGIISELQAMLEMSEDEGMKGEFLSRVNALESALSESKMCIEVLEGENQSRQEQLEDLLLTLDDLTAKAERLEEIESGGGQGAESSVEQEEVDPDDLLAQVQQSAGVEKGDESDYSDEKVELERERIGVKRQLEAITEEKQELAEQLREQQEKVSELQNIIAKYSHETGDVMNAVVTLEDENDRLMEEVDQIRHEKEELEARMNGPQDEELSGQQDVDPDDIDALLAGAGDILNEIHEEDLANEQAKNRDEEEFKQVSEYINKEIDNEVDELERQNQDLNEELTQSKGALDSKHEELEKALEEFNQKQEELEKAQSELQVMKEEIEEKDTLYERLKKEYTEMELVLEMKV